MGHKKSHLWPIRQLMRRLHEDCSGATSTEYMLILAFIIIPLGIMMQTIIPYMYQTYGQRLISLMPLPFP